MMNAGEQEKCKMYVQQDNTKTACGDNIPAKAPKKTSDHKKSVQSPKLKFYDPEPVDDPKCTSPPLTEQDKLSNLVQCFLISLTGLPLGWDVGTMGHLASSRQFENIFGKKSIESSIVLGTIVSILTLGCITGAATLGGRAGRIGMKLTIWMGSVFYIAGTGVELLAVNLSKTHWAAYVVGRFLTGIYIGILGVVGPTYIGNIIKIRAMKKMCISWHQICCCIAILLGNVFIIAFEQDPNLPNIIGISKLAIALLLLLSIYFVPESRSKAAFHKHTDHLRLGEKVPTSGYFQAIEGIVFDEEFCRNFKCALVMVLQQFTGINFYFYYSGFIFTGMSSILASTILSSVNCATSFFAGFILEKLGYKKTLYFGSICMSFCMFAFASIGLSKHMMPDVDNEILIILIASTFIVLFSASWGPGASVMVNDISQSSQSMAIAVCSNWASNFIVSMSIPYLTHAIGFGVGYIFAAFLASGAIFVKFWGK